MKTISTHLNKYNHIINQLITTNNSYRNHKYYQNDNHASGDINRNATVAEAECQRDTCEEELYRLRFGMEQLLANNEYGDFKGRQRQRFRTTNNKFSDVNSMFNKNRKIF